MDRDRAMRGLGDLSSADLQKFTSFTRTDVVENRIADVAAELGEFVFGQEEACLAVAKAMVRTEAGLSDHEKPLGTFIFLGPTGVGKTEMAKAIAQVVAVRSGHPGEMERHYVEIDSILLQDQTSVTRLTGASPNYIGYGDPPLITPDQLAEGVVVNFDEIEKAHSSIARWLLPAIDKGKTKVSAPTGENSKSRVNVEEVAMVDLDFTDSYIVMTANVGAREINDRLAGRQRIGFRQKETEQTQTREEIRDLGLKALRDHFKWMPEFLGRIPEDNIIVFSPLANEDFIRIFDKALQRINLSQELRNPTNYNPLFATHELRDHVIRIAALRGLGARAITHTVENLIVSRAADIKSGGGVPIGAPLVANIADGQISFYTMDLDLSPPLPRPIIEERFERAEEEARTEADKDKEGLLSDEPPLPDQNEPPPDLNGTP